MNDYSGRRFSGSLGEVVEMAYGGQIPFRPFPGRKTEQHCDVCGEILWEFLRDGVWALSDCLNCYRIKEEQEAIAEILRQQAARSQATYSQATFDNFTTELPHQSRGLTAAREFHPSRGEPTAIMFYSAPIGKHSGYGTGKTHLASAISNILREDGWNVLSWLAPDLFSRIKSTYNSEEDTEWQIIRMATQCDLLVFDDIGKEHIKETNRSWHCDLYYRIINARYQRGPLIVTTNLDIVDLPAHIGGGAFSRLWEMCGGRERIIDMSGPDYRFLKMTNSAT